MLDGVIKWFLDLFKEEDDELFQYVGKFYITNTTIEKDIFKAKDARRGKNSEIILITEKYLTCSEMSQSLTEDISEYNLSEVSEISQERLEGIKNTLIENLKEFFEK